MKTFLLGVGAQKGGTTWVFQYLERHPECQMGVVKEKAVFNASFATGDTKTRRLQKIDYLQTVLGEYRQAVKQSNPKLGPSPEALMERFEIIAAEADPNVYIQLFERLWARPGTKLVGDITPSYSMLNVEELTQIRQLLESNGFHVKPVLLMRDPLERCYSAIRMGDRNAQQQGRAPKKPAAERFAEAAVQDWCLHRTQYDVIVPNLETVFGRDNIYFGFYETFFSDEEVFRLCDFLGIERVAPNLDKLANYSPRTSEPSAEQLATVRAFYDPTYSYCADRFGADFIDRIWPHANLGSVVGEV
ncbi:sulfotransferase [Thalassococcus sp. S3]|uniref:sulfotransferase n=1 Tax=Thalassococcus sp. S3 TaxID=2017482 RepID=UPI00102408B2|nr:sulfotransferase [Thalassococcus sp. S3]QBF34244.1 hypothetical protein CFI11_23960 [Thalassococcus sp. S3]